MRLNAAALSVSGNVMTVNEDRFFVCGHYPSGPDSKAASFETTKSGDALLAVFDGMGGESDGDVIAELCAGLLGTYAAEGHTDFTDFFTRANKKTLEYMALHNGRQSGAAAVLLSVQNGVAVSYNTGDCRCYLFRNGSLTCLSSDHTEIQRLVRIGFMTPEQAALDSRRHILTRFIGNPECEGDIEPYLSEPVQIEEGDCFLLCSDGLHDTLGSEPIIRCLSDASLSASAAVRKLVRCASVSGSEDNITAVVLKAANINRI